MNGIDFSCLPADLAAVERGTVQPLDGDQLCLPFEPAEAEFRRWLESQPMPDWIEAAS